MPHVLAIEQRQRQEIDTRTPTGIYNAVLAETDNKELAARVAAEVATHQAMARLNKQGPL